MKVFSIIGIIIFTQTTTHEKKPFHTYRIFFSRPVFIRISKVLIPKPAVLVLKKKKKKQIGVKNWNKLASSSYIPLVRPP